MATTTTAALDIESLRRTRGVSQQQLADAAGIPRTTLRRKIVRPGTFSLDEAAGISRVLGITAEQWLGEVA